MVCETTAQGWRCEKNKIIRFSSPLDAANPLTSHSWELDDSVVSTGSEFTHVFSEADTHTLKHSGSNVCGASCSLTKTLEIVEGPITPTAPIAVAKKSNAVPLFVVGFVGLALLGVIMKK